MIPPPLAHPEFWREHGYPTFSKFWEVCNRLLDALNKFTLNAGKAKDKNETIIRSLCMSTGISFADVGMLVGNGCGLSAMRIARTCLESAINAECLRLEPTEHGEFMDWSFIEQHRKLEYMRQHMPGDFARLDSKMVADSEQRYQEVKPTFMLPNKKLRRSWCRLSLHERALKTHFEEIYSIVYMLSSELLHGSFGGLAQHVETFVGDNWQPAIPPSLIGCAPALQTGHYCAFRALQTLVQSKGTDSTPPILDLKNDYDYAWSEKQRD
jgi:hypothetical protein